MPAQRVPRIRSYSLNGGLNPLGDGFLDDQLPGWPYLSARKYSQLVTPPPSNVYTFVDVEERCIDSGDFSFWVSSVTAPLSWFHLPADRNNRGANLGYADSHAAYQRWRWPKVFRQYGQQPANQLDRADLNFFLEHAARK